MNIQTNIEDTPTDWMKETESKLSQIVETAEYMIAPVIATLAKARCSVEDRKEAGDKFGYFTNTIIEYADDVSDAKIAYAESTDSSAGLFCKGVEAAAGDLLQSAGDLYIVQDFLAAQCQVIYWRIQREEERQSLAVAELKRVTNELPVQSGLAQSVQESQDEEHKASEKLNESAEVIAFYENILDGLKEVYTRVVGGNWAPQARRQEKNPEVVVVAAAANAILAQHESSIADPSQTKRYVVFGSADEVDHKFVWSKLDELLAKSPTLTIYTGTQRKGVEAITRAWCEERKIQFIAADPEWNRVQAKKHDGTPEYKDDGTPKFNYDRAAGFKRNRSLLKTANPHGIVLFEGGSGVVRNWAELAKAHNVTLWQPKN